MAYTTEALVKAEFREISIGASTLVTSSDVTEFISQADAEVNAAVAVKYEVPIDATEHPYSFPLVRQASTWLVAHRVGQILQIKSIVEQVNQEGAVISLRDRAEKMLEAIRSGKLILSDADPSTTEVGVSDYNSANAVSPLFDVETEQF